MICLDTNAVIAVLNDRASPVRTRIDATIQRGRSLAISPIVLFELRYGAAKSARPERNMQRISDFLAGAIAVLPFEPEDAEEAGDIRAALERAGTPIGPYDVLIAAQARRRDALLVTTNEREFARVPGLTDRRLGGAGMIGTRESIGLTCRSAPPARAPAASARFRRRCAASPARPTSPRGSGRPAAGAAAPPAWTRRE